MAQPRPCVEEVIDALRDLGGEGSLSDIYRQIRKQNRMDFEANTQWTAAVRNALEKHSSDSEAFAGHGNYFKSVHGIGHGRWGLR